LSQTISKFSHGGPRANSGGLRPGAGRPWKIPDEPIAIIPHGLRWCVYQSQPQAERRAAEEITRAGYRGYMPLIAVRKQDPVIRSMYHKVLLTRFPGYGFLELGPTDRWREPFQDMAGRPRILLGADGRPARIPVGELERHMLDDDRLCDLARETMPAFKARDRVIILDGALASHEGDVLECDGLVTTVEVMMFRRPMPYRLDRAAVEAV
jgi:transcription antitermination factor NusG